MSIERVKIMGRHPKEIVNIKQDELSHLMMEMPEALRHKLDWMLDWFNDDRRYTLTSRWSLGHELQDITKAENENDKRYGVSALSKLEKFVDDDPSLLRVAIKIATYWQQAEIEKIADMVMADGVTHISYSHIRVLTSMDDADDRNRFLHQAIKHNWTSSQLGAAVVSEKGKRSNNSQGRGVAIPKDAAMVIKQQMDFADDFDKRNLKVWKDPQHSLTSQLAKIEAEEYTQELADTLGVLAKRMRQLAEEADKRAEEAEHKYAEVSAAIKQRIRSIKSTTDFAENEAVVTPETQLLSKGSKLKRRQTAMV